MAGRRAGARLGDATSRATAPPPGWATSSRSRRCRRCSPASGCRRADPARLGEVQHRPPQERRRCGRHAEVGPRPRPQGAPAEPGRRPAQPDDRLRHLAAVHQHRAPRVDASHRTGEVRRRQRLRLRRHQLPRRGGGVRSRADPARGRPAHLRRLGPGRCGRRDRAPPRPRCAAPSSWAASDRRGRHRQACEVAAARPTVRSAPGPAAPARTSPPRYGWPSTTATPPSSRRRRARPRPRSESDNPAMWKALRNQGVFLGRGPAPRVAFLYTGQGSQYVNMLATLRDVDPVVAETIADSDRITSGCWAGRCRRSPSPTPPTRRPWRRPRKSSARPRSPSRPSHDGPGPDPPAGVLRHRPRHGDGPQPRRVRRARRGRRHALRRRPRSGGGPRDTR